MSVVYINGFETGDASGIDTLGAGASIQSSVVRTGAYAFKYGTAAGKFTVNSASGLTTSQSAIRVYINTAATPSASSALFAENPNTTTRFRLFLLLTSGFLQVNDAGATLGLGTTSGSINICDGNWHRIEIALDLAAAGVVKVWVDGVLDISVTHSSDVSATKTTSWGCGGFATAVIYMDDLRIDQNTLTQIGSGQIINRQGKAGTPAYDAWAKVGAATAALCWSDTPVGTTTSCTSIASGDAQTMLVAPFSATQSGHGTQVVNTGDTINACQIGMIIKEATASGGKIRRRINGTDTDTTPNVALGTTDGFRNDGIWSTSVANLDLLEAGYLKSANVNLTTVEDVWVIVDYSVLPKVITAVVGAFTLTGVAAGLLFGRKLSVTVGTFTLTGIAAALKYARIMTATVTTFVLTGVAASLLFGRKLSVTVGVFNLAGVAAALKYARIMTAAAGAFALTGVATSLKFGRYLAAGVGAFILTGIDATLTYSGALISTGNDWLIRARRRGTR